MMDFCGKFSPKPTPNQIMKLQNRGLTLFVNNGNTGIADATIPLKWKLDQNLCQIGPQHMLLFVQHESEQYKASLNHDHGLMAGERRIIKLTDGELFIQFNRPGSFKVTVMLLNPGADVPVISKMLLKKTGRRRYEHFVYLDELHQAVNTDRPQGSISSLSVSDFLMSQTFEVAIPEELFAKRPQSALAKWFFGIVNLWHKYEPVDQCELRKRTIMSLMLPFWLIMLGRLFMSLWSLILTVYLVGGRFLVLLLGYRPQPFLKGVGEIWETQVADGNFMDTHDLKYYEDFKFIMFIGPYGWRTWAYVGGETHRGQRRVLDHELKARPESVRRMPASPLGLILNAALVWLFLVYWSSTPFVLEALSVFIVTFTAGLIALRVAKPFYKTGGNYRYWEDDCFFLTRALWDCVITSTTLVVLWTAIIHGQQALDEITSLWQSLWSWILNHLTHIIVGGVSILIGLLIVRSIKSMPKWASVLIEKIKTAIEARRLERLRLEDIRQQKLRTERKALADKLRAEWEQKRPQAATVGHPQSVLLLDAKDCPNCEPQTWGDKFRLIFWRTKAKVCRPYAS